MLVRTLGSKRVDCEISRQLGKETKCNDPSTLLVDIVLFGLSLTGFPRGFKTCLLEESFHILINGVLFWAWAVTNDIRARHQTMCQLSRCSPEGG